MGELVVNILYGLMELLFLATGKLVLKAFGIESRELRASLVGLIVWAIGFAIAVIAITWLHH